MRTDHIPKSELEMLLRALMWPNRLAIETSMHTGLRISDVLRIGTAQLSQRMRIRELKTGKARTVTLPKRLYGDLRALAGKHWVFEGRLDSTRHRTRQAVFKDIKAAARRFKLKANVAPHTARKVYAVEQYAKDGNMKRVQELLKHDNEAVTVIYALADQMTERVHKARRRK